MEVPLNFVLGTSAVAIRKAPLLLVDLETEEGRHRPHATFSATCAAAAPAIISLLGEVERIVKGEAIAPAELWAKLARRFTLIGVQGIVRMAMSASIPPAWDALAIAAGKPLANFLGAPPRPIPAYNSCGLGLKDDLGALADEAEKLLAGGFRAVKLRLGYPTVREDIAAVHAVRKRIGDDVALMVDYNQALGARGSAHARSGARCRKYLLARGADPPRRLCRRREAGARTQNADPDRREFLASGGDASRA